MTYFILKLTGPPVVKKGLKSNKNIYIIKALTNKLKRIEKVKNGNR